MKNENKVTFTYLKSLNKEIKSNDLTRQQKAFNILKALETKDIGLLIYNKYLQGKVHYLNYKRDNSLESLEKAVHCYHSIFILGRQHRINVKSPKYFFKYAETLHLLSKRVFCLFEQNRLHNKAYKIAIHSSIRYPNNSSLLWLKRHILES